MKKYLFLLIVLVGGVAGAAETIFDTSLMNQETWAEPYFPNEEELLREPDSEAMPQKEYVKNSDEYLDVLKKIPASDPSISRAWIEYKILHEN